MQTNSAASRDRSSILLWAVVSKLCVGWSVNYFMFTQQFFSVYFGVGRPPRYYERRSLNVAQGRLAKPDKHAPFHCCHPQEVPACPPEWNSAVYIFVGLMLALGLKCLSTFSVPACGAYISDPQSVRVLCCAYFMLHDVLLHFAIFAVTVAIPMRILAIRLHILKKAFVFSLHVFLLYCNSHC